MSNPLERHLLVSFCSKRRKTGPGMMIKPYKPILRELPIIDPAAPEPLRKLMTELADIRFSQYRKSSSIRISSTCQEHELVHVGFSIKIHPADDHGMFLTTLKVIVKGEEIHSQEFKDAEPLEFLGTPAPEKSPEVTLSSPVEINVYHKWITIKDELGEAAAGHFFTKTKGKVVGTTPEQARTFDILSSYYDFENDCFQDIGTAIKKDGTILSRLWSSVRECISEYTGLREELKSRLEEAKTDLSIPDLFDWEYLEASIDAVQTTFRDSIEMFWP